MRRITIADLRVASPCGAVLSRPVFDFEVKRSGQCCLQLCSSDFSAVGQVGAFRAWFKGAARTVWAQGRAFDTRAINSRAMEFVDWQGQPAATLFGDVVIQMPKKHWDYVWIGTPSDYARQALQDVGMDDVAVLSTPYVRGGEGCFIAAARRNRLAMAKLAAA